MKLNAIFLLSLAVALSLNMPAQSSPQSAKAKVTSKTTATSKGKKSAQHNVVVQQMRSPPAATLASGHNTQLELGCLDFEKILQVKNRLQLELPNDAALFSSQPPVGTCLPYSAAVTVPLVRNALVLLAPSQAEDTSNALMYSRNSTDINATQAPWRFTPGTEPLRQILTSNLRAEGAELQEVPTHLQWEVDLMAKHMLSALKVEPNLHQLRITLTPDVTSSVEKIYAIELFETANGNRAEIAVWLDRPNVPGAYFSMQGLDYERVLWKSPVQFTRISRGVGPSVTTVTRRVAVKSRKKSKSRMVVRTLKVKGHHIGIDFAAPIGTPVVAVADGEIIHAGVNGGYGNLIIIDHGEGHHTYYAHLSAFSQDIKPGTLVRRGEEIGYVGSTGFSTGPHLHFEIRKEGQFIDPNVRENKLRFWTLDPQEQPQILARLLQLQAIASQQLLTPAAVR